MSQHSRRQILAAMVAGAAGGLAAPVIRTVPAAAQVVGSCALEVLDWETLPKDDVFVSTDVNGTTISLTTVMVGDVEFKGDNGKVKDKEIGGQPKQHVLMLEMKPKELLAGQIVTFTFSQPVINVTVPIFDIDNKKNQFNDRVVPSGAFTSSLPAGSTVIGTGTAADPFRNSDPDEVKKDEPFGNLVLNWAGIPGGITSVSFLYYGDVWFGKDMEVAIGNLTFQPCP